VTQDVVGFADDLFAVEAAGDDELLVAVGDVAGQIGAADDGGAVGDRVFVTCDGQILRMTGSRA
jgi:hypothetical protein